jgi:hypothetical protein
MTGIDRATLDAWLETASDPDPNRDTAFDADEALPVTVVNLTNCPETGYTDNASLPPPWDMSICQLDGWNAYHAARQRLGRALTDAERAHWDEVRGQLNARHEARRHSDFS